MAYEKQAWQDESESHAATAARFLHIEDGVDLAHDNVDALDVRVANLEGVASTQPWQPIPPTITGTTDGEKLASLISALEAMGMIQTDPPSTDLYTQEQLWFPYSNPFNQKIPSGQADHADSALVRANIIDSANSSRLGFSQEATVYTASDTDPLYAVRKTGGTNWTTAGGVPIQARVPAGAVTGQSPDSYFILLDPTGNCISPSYGAKRMLRGFKVSVDHTNKVLTADVNTGWSIINYSRANGQVYPEYGMETNVDQGFGRPFSPTGYASAGAGTGWAGVLRGHEINHALTNGGTVPSPNIAALKAAVPHALRITVGERFHSFVSGRRHWMLPAVKSDNPDADQGGRVQMGMRLRLEEAMTDSDILARRPAKWPTGNAPSGHPMAGASWHDVWTQSLRAILFAVRDYGIVVSDSVPGSDVSGLQREHDATGNWTTLWGTETSAAFYAEMIRDTEANATDGGSRAAEAGMPTSRISVPSVSVY